jgi:hypothetical protein
MRGTEGNCVVGQVLFLTVQESVQKTPAKEPSSHRVNTDVIEQFLQTRPPVGAEGAGLGETDGAGFFGISTEGAGFRGVRPEGAGLEGVNTEGAGFST